MADLPTIRVRSGKGSAGYVLINARDYAPGTHVLWTETGPEIAVMAGDECVPPPAGLDDLAPVQPGPPSLDDRAQRRRRR